MSNNPTAAAAAAVIVVGLENSAIHPQLQQQQGSFFHRNNQFAPPNQPQILEFPQLNLNQTLTQNSLVAIQQQQQQHIPSHLERFRSQVAYQSKSMNTTSDSASLSKQQASPSVDAGTASGFGIQQKTRRDLNRRPVNKLTVDLIKTYKNINEVSEKHSKTLH